MLYHESTTSHQIDTLTLINGYSSPSSPILPWEGCEVSSFIPRSDLWFYRS
ncbi:MAG: hypothetical protein H6Q19_1351 [Bacteroidetes bacterium]|nr:hypothetical protein [Bacteroidota bacterium]